MTLTCFFYFIHKRGPLPEDLAKNIFSQVVNIAHAKNDLHQDIKDESLLLDLINNHV